MTPSMRLHVQIAPVALIVAALAAADGYIRPERALVWLTGLATMAVIWLVATLVDRSPSQTDAQRAYLRLSVRAAGLMLAAALGVALVRAVGVEDGGLSKRAVSIATGIALAALGNALPKVAGPLAARRCSPAQMQSLQRFAGWSFTLAGLGYALVWMVGPVQRAETMSTMLCAVAVALVVGRCAGAWKADGAL